MKMYMVHDLIRGGWSAFWKTRSWDGSQIILVQSQIPSKKEQHNFADHLENVY